KYSLKIDYEEDFKCFEEQSSNIEESAQNAAEALDAPIVEQTFVTNTGTTLLTIITNNDLAINTAIANVLPNTYHVHYIFHIGQNLIKNLKDKFGERYNEFFQNWYQMYNALSYQQFDLLWNELLKKFSEAASYFDHVLFGEKKH
ncbi:8518_t:CDS:2, partial [Gigaspora rosea]